MEICTVRFIDEIDRKTWKIPKFYSKMAEAWGFPIHSSAHVSDKETSPSLRQ